MKVTRRELLTFFAVAGACSVTGGLRAAAPPLQPSVLDVEEVRRFLLQPVPCEDFFEWHDLGQRHDLPLR